MVSLLHKFFFFLSGITGFYLQDMEDSRNALKGLKVLS